MLPSSPLAAVQGIRRYAVMFAAETVTMLDSFSSTTVVSPLGEDVTPKRRGAPASPDGAREGPIRFRPFGCSTQMVVPPTCRCEGQGCTSRVEPLYRSGTCKGTHVCLWHPETPAPYLPVRDWEAGTRSEQLPLSPPSLPISRAPEPIHYNTIPHSPRQNGQLWRDAERSSLISPTGDQRSPPPAGAVCRPTTSLSPSRAILATVTPSESGVINHSNPSTMRAHSHVGQQVISIVRSELIIGFACRLGSLILLRGAQCPDSNLLSIAGLRADAKNKPA